jgi:hypothetical protein
MGASNVAVGKSRDSAARFRKLFENRKTRPKLRSAVHPGDLDNDIKPRLSSWSAVEILRLLEKEVREREIQGKEPKTVTRSALYAMKKAMGIME